MGPRWQLRETEPALAAQYRHTGLWSGETLGALLHEHLKNQAGLDVRIWSASRPWVGTVGDVHRAARRFAAWLQDRGVAPGDVVAFQLPNCVEAAVVFWGSALAGAVLVPIVHFYGAKEVGYVLEQLQPTLFVRPDLLGGQSADEVLAPALDTWRRSAGAEPRHEAIVRLTSPAGAAGQVAFVDDLGVTGELGEPESAHPDGPALIAYTSGTTANPKGVIHTHHSIVAEIRQLSDIQPPDPRPMLTGAPVGHAIGMLTGLLLPVYRNQAVHLIDLWNPPAVLDAMLAGDLTAGSGATFFLLSLLDDPGLSPEHLERMRYVGLGGSAVPEAVTQRAVDLGISVARSYGSTEHPSVTGAPHDLPQERRARSDGRPLTGVDIRIVDSDGQEVPAGSAGEIWTRGPDLCAGYTDPALTAVAFDEDGWYHSGDVGVLDEQGWLRITDRLADVIIRGGENISAVEVEDLLLLMDEVAEAAVVAAPDPRLGEHACAFIRLRDPDSPAPDLDAIQGHLRRHGLAKQKWPEEVQITSDLPRTPSGKVRKADLRARLR